MHTLDAHPLTDLVGRVGRVRDTLPSVPLAVPVHVPIHFPPPHLTVTTELVRGTTTFGYVITPSSQPAPTGPNITLHGGTLWFLATQLGAQFSATAGFVGIPFSGASLHVSGNVTFSAGKITLDAGASLRFDVASTTVPVTAPPNDPIGVDFSAAKLTPSAHASINFAPAAASITLAGKASATLYGQDVTLDPEAAAPLKVDFTTPHVALPCKVEQPTFTVAKSKSDDFRVAGSASIVSGGVVFPIIDAVPTALPDPGDAWGIIVVTGAGLSARFGTLAKPQPLVGASFALTPARVVGLVETGAARIHQRFALWKSPAPPSPLPRTRPPLALPESDIVFDSPGNSLIAFSATPSEELVLIPGALDARVDRPIGADGQRIVLQGPALLSRTHTTAAVRIDVGSTLSPKALSSIALVTPNALMPVGTPDALVLSGTLLNDRISGTLEVGFPTGVVIPTFPDPYAARYIAPPQQEHIVGVVAKVTWTDTSDPALTFELVPATPGVAATGTLATPGAASTTPARQIGFAAPSAAVERRGGVAFGLLDVSTNADQWGLAVTLEGVAKFGFTELDLNAPSADTFVFTVPGISWEPVVDTAGVVPQWLAAFSANDGTPTMFLVATTDATPLIPITALQLNRSRAFKAGSETTFTLPFGMTANMVDTRRPDASPSYEIPSAKFTDAGLRTARVLSIRGQFKGDPLTVALPGTTNIDFNGTAANSGYGSQVLGVDSPITQSPAFYWNHDFGPTGTQQIIPVGRVDLSGYGTSTFSDWHDPLPDAVGVVRALFNVLLGRTAHELVTLQTWIVPWSIRLQRTITFDRDDAGEVIKHDTGWKAVADGKFELLDPGAVLPGPVVDLTNVRNIQFSTGADVVVTTPARTWKYTRCTFDADVAFANGVFIAADGANPAKTAVGTTIQGYASEPDSVPPSSPPGKPPENDDILALMKQQGRVIGTAHAIARIGGADDSRFALNMTSFGAAFAPGAMPRLQTAIFATPRLPKDGQWSIARRSATAARPSPIDPQTPVPFTIGTSSAKPPPTNSGSFASGFRLLDPEDAQSVDNPQTFYGILQGTGSSKTFFEHPLVNDTGQALGFGNVPKLADVGALLGVGDIFPDIGNVLQIPSTDGLPLNADGFKKTYTWPTGPYSVPDRSLLDIAIVHLLLSYSAPQPNGGPDLPFKGELVLDANPSAPNWSLKLKNLSFKAKVDGFGSDPLLTVAGGFQAGSSIKPGFIGPDDGSGTPQPLQVIYGSALDAVKQLFSGLSELAKSLGGDADLDVGFSGQTLSVRQGFALPTLPLGFGEITHLGIDLGFSATIPTDLAFHVGIGSKKDPFQWVVSPLAGNGAIELGVQGGGLAVFIEAGLGLGLSIDVVVASGSASIVISISLTVATGRITITLMLIGNADVEVLGGVASASLTLSAAISVSFPAALPPPDATLAAQVSVGIHISICWVISIDFDGSWSFSETIALT